MKLLVFIIFVFQLAYCREVINMSNAPIAEKVPSKFNMHNQEIKDDYSWLRDANWPKVSDTKILSYLKEENNYYNKFFEGLEDHKEQVYQELKAKIKLADQSTYIKSDDYYYYNRTQEHQQYPIYCRKFKSIQAKEEIILDVNKLAEGKSFTKISAISVSPDHSMVAYSIDFTGNEKYTIKILDLNTSQYLQDEIPDTLGDIIWHEKINGFFYTPTTDNWRCEKVMFHTLGKVDDKQIFWEQDPLYQVSVGKSSSKDYILIGSGGHSSNETYAIPMLDTQKMEAKLIIPKEEDIFYDIDHNGRDFYIHTNKNAANFRILRANKLEDIQLKSEIYICEEADQYLTGFDVTKNYIILNYKKLGIPVIKVIDINTNQEKTINFPDAAFTASAYSTNFKEDDIRVSYSSLKQPSTVYQYGFEQAQLSILKVQEIPSGFNPDEYSVERAFVDYDNVSVPITIMYKKSLFKHDGSNPLYLYGYGAYGMAVDIGFRNTAVSIADRGIVFAIAHIRGGDELGHAWYEASKFLNKKRTFNDFIESARYLIKHKYTSQGNIAIYGGSAGGLLVGNVINQAPELFKLVVAHVPFVDALNTMLDDTLPLTAGEFKEWGNPKEHEYFEYIKSYSPYDNIKSQDYPMLLVTAGISDPRVGYWEAAKWVAKLRDMKTDDNIMIFKTNMDSGHMGASGRFEYLKEIAEDLVFIFKAFDKL